ncbi:CDP-diglyceride synthetase [Candidatus Pantoea edessiphila]|uniref:Phosphatidate cytidylyltransferase n=1 Tax=Candidatus Pantoea edessiphila TaxID=2044610 RepID=A0A2P5SWF1_9GAMM|nr:CDP-diglyceride synthetase [Candidatus Pantoea edessiphila]
MINNRLFTAIILIIFVIFAVFLLSPLNFEIISILICTIAAWEWSKLSGVVLWYNRILIAILFGLILLTLMFFFKIYNCNLHSLLVISLLMISISWWILALFLVLTYPRSSIFWKNSCLTRIAFGVFTLIPLFYILSVFRYLHYNENKFTGSWYILFIMCLVWSIDSSAYFFGQTFGKNKLSPVISPNKTWEGFFCSLVVSFLIVFLFSNFKLIDLSKKSLIIFSTIITFASLLGDLTESMLKREIGLKDSSNIIPGHGGLLDRIDSLTTVIPVFGLFMTTSIKYF